MEGMNTKRTATNLLTITGISVFTIFAVTSILTNNNESSVISIIQNIILKIRARKELQKQLLLLLEKSKDQIENEDDNNDNDNRVVNDLFIYPVKSLRAVSVLKVELDDKGFKNDRQYMIVSPVPTPIYGSFLPTDSTHRFLSQRQCPILATITATIKNDEDNLTLNWNDKSITIPCQPISKPIKTYRAGIWSDQVQVDDMGDQVAEFIQSIVNLESNCRAGDEGDVSPLKEEEKGEKDAASSSNSSIYSSGIRLVSHNHRNDRFASMTFIPPIAKTWFNKGTSVSLNDGFPILIACTASLDELNKRLIAKNKKPIQMSRFRPNIVIQTTKPFEEDNWKIISIGSICLAIVKGCPRCKQSCTDQDTGIVSDEPVSTMKEFRALGDGDNSGDVYFAQNAVPIYDTGYNKDGKMIIESGAPVRVLQWGDPIYA